MESQPHPAKITPKQPRWITGIGHRLAGDSVTQLTGITQRPSAHLATEGSEAAQRGHP